MEACQCSPECPVPYGLCHCGCGQETPLASQTSLRNGWVAGQPTKFIRGHAGRNAVHGLIDIDTVARTATCSSCGPVTVKRNGTTKATGRPVWKCCRRLITQHWLEQINEATETAFCRGCGSVVPITFNTARGKGWVCALKRREDAQERRGEKADEIREKHTEWRQENPQHLSRMRLTKYGLTQADFDLMVAERHNLCDICQRGPDGRRHLGVLFVDHDHGDGKVRGLLEHNCNVGLGAFKDDPVLLARAIVYLKPGPAILKAIGEHLLREAEGAQAHTEVR